MIDETPVATGELQAGNKIAEIKKSKNSVTVAIVNDVPYGRFVDHGHYNVRSRTFAPAQPFFRGPLERAKGRGFIDGPVNPFGFITGDFLT